MPLLLDAYYVDRLALDVVEDYDDDAAEQHWEIDVRPQHLTNTEDPLAQQVVLSVRFEPAEGSSAPYRGEIAGRAFFRVCDEEPDKASSLVRFNGSSILFGLLRGQVAQLTAFARWSTFLMPPVNLVEAFERADEAEVEEATSPPEPAKKKTGAKGPAGREKPRKAGGES